MSEGWHVCEWDRVGVEVDMSEGVDKQRRGGGWSGPGRELGGRRFLIPI